MPFAPSNVAGDSSVLRAVLVERNLGLVRFALAPLIRQYSDLCQSDRDDMTSAGYLGLCQAAAGYDPSKGAFSTYAMPFIRFAGRKALTRIGDPDAREAGITLSSLDAPLSRGEGSSASGASGELTRLADMVADPNAGAAFYEVLDTAAQSDQTVRLWTWIGQTLTEKQARALWLWYGEEKTQAEAAFIAGTSASNFASTLRAGVQRLRRATQNAFEQNAISKHRNTGLRNTGLPLSREIYSDEDF